jgi:fluoride exporter
MLPCLHPNSIIEFRAVQSTGENLMQKVIVMALAGAAGTLARYWLSSLVQQVGAFPWGTFAVNMIGSFLFGVVWTLAEERMVISADTRLIILTGFMGAFTTFSTFMFETSNFLRQSQWLLAFGNIALQLLVGLACMFLGLAVGRLL